LAGGLQHVVNPAVAERVFPDDIAVEHDVLAAAGRLTGALVIGSGAGRNVAFAQLHARRIPLK
jgi:hypothetical protein